MKENECHTHYSEFQHFQHLNISALPDIKFTDVMLQMQTKTDKKNTPKRKHAYMYHIFLHDAVSV